MSLEQDLNEIRVKGIEVVADFYGAVDLVEAAVDLIDSVNLSLCKRGDGANLFYKRESLVVTVHPIKDAGDS